MSTSTQNTIAISLEIPSLFISYLRHAWESLSGERRDDLMDF